MLHVYAGLYKVPTIGSQKRIKTFVAYLLIFCTYMQVHVHIYIYINLCMMIYVASKSGGVIA